MANNMHINKRNFRARNFGLGNRCLIRAGTNALKEAQSSFVTVAVNTNRWTQFVNYLREHSSVKDLRQITRANVVSYASHLRKRCDAGELSTSTAHNYLSVVNRILEIARGDQLLRVTAVRDAKLTRRKFVAQVSHATPEPEHQTACSTLHPHIVSILRLQRLFGLRFEESAKLSPTRALGQALRDGSIRITDGTKGGRPRAIPVTSEQQTIALKEAIQYQSSRKSLIPAHMTYASFKFWCYREIKKLEIRFHGERHAYACARYRVITGVFSPVESGKTRGDHIAEIASSLGVSHEEAKRIDRAARFQIAEELGHSRSQITNVYLGR